MNSKFLKTHIFFALFFYQTAKAQVYSTLVDNTTKYSLSGATVKLQSKADSSIFFSAITNDSGYFSFSQVQNGTFTIIISRIGYEQFISSFVIKDNTKHFLSDTIPLVLSSKTLSEVTVSGKKDFILVKADKITLNVAESPIAAGSNAYEVILRVPGVTEQGNSISFRGKNVSVLINGRPVQISGDDLKTILTNMPANNIEKIEVLPNPSAKYEAAGSSIIDIKMVKNKNYGLNGNYTAGIYASKYLGGNTGTTLNYRNKNINIYGSYNYKYNKQYYHSTFDRTLKDNVHILENENEIRSMNNNAYSIGVDYDLNKNSTVGILLRGYTNSRNKTAINKNLLLHAAPELDSLSVVNTKGFSKYFNPSFNLYYKTTLDSTGKLLTLNTDYFRYDKTSRDDFKTGFFDNNEKPYLTPYLLRDNSHANIIVQSLSTDYVSPLKNGSIEIGLKSTFTKTDNNLLWEYEKEGGWLNDVSKSNHFIYDENINAAYVNYNTIFKAKYEISAGLRAENTNNSGKSLTLNTAINHSYINFFPNIRITYNKDDDNSFSISYRKSIYRFGFNVVNPFVIYQNQYSYYKGNPNIQPEIDHNFDINYSYKRGLVFGVSYEHQLKVLAPVYVKGFDNVVISSQENLNSGDMLYFYNNWNKEISKGWISNLSTMVGFLKYNLSTKEQSGSNSNWVLQMDWNNSFAFKNGWNAEFTGSYLTPYASGIFKLQQLFSADIGINKSILNKKANVKLSVSDIINSYHQVTDINYQGVIMHQRENDETRFFKIQFTYKFGNKNVKKVVTRESKLEEVEKRIGE